jgi:hypothetical protein
MEWLCGRMPQFACVGRLDASIRVRADTLEGCRSPSEVYLSALSPPIQSSTRCSGTGASRRGTGPPADCSAGILRPKPGLQMFKQDPRCEVRTDRPQPQGPGSAFAATLQDEDLPCLPATGPHGVEPHPNERLPPCLSSSECPRCHCDEPRDRADTKIS